ncbi:MAG: glycosyltransferase [Candidatus Omnitrophota bacterium]|nr:glycosyltransferase [Candidatus Omnitrophota bacterium]
MPAVSVIVPIFRCAAYVGRALESVFAQTWQDLEVLVIDGSPEEHEAALAPYRARIRYAKQRAVGVSAARNLGMRQACGDVIAFLDGDDTWLPEKLAQQIELLRRHPDVGLVFTDGHQIDHTGRIIRATLLPERHPSFIAWCTQAATTNPKVQIGSLYEVLLSGNCIPTSSVVVRRTCLQELGGFNEAYPVAEDYDLWLRVARKYSVALLREVTTQYRVRDDGLSGSAEMRLARWREADAKVLAAYLDEAPEPLRRLIRARISHCSRLASWHYLRQGQGRRARPLLLTSLAHRWRQPKILLYLAASFFMPSRRQRDGVRSSDARTQGPSVAI